MSNCNPRITSCDPTNVCCYHYTLPATQALFHGSVHPKIGTPTKHPETYHRDYQYIISSPACALNLMTSVLFETDMFHSCMTLIRGFGATERYQKDFGRQVKALASANLASSGVVSWVSLYQDLTTNLLILGCFIATTQTRHTVDEGLPALSILLLLLHMPSPETHLREPKKRPTYFQAIVTPGSLVVTLPTCAVTIILYRLHKPCSMVLSILRSELQQNTLKHITETISPACALNLMTSVLFETDMFHSCMTLIRGFGATERYQKDFGRQVKALASANLASSGVVSWVSLYQDLTTNLLILGCFIATTQTRHTVDEGLPALSILLLLLHMPHTRQLWNILDSCDVISRSLDNCTKLAFHSEREHATPRFKPPSEWPQHGHISFEDVYAGMSADSESVLRGISLQIEAGTKLGVGSSPNGGKVYIVPLIFRFNLDTRGLFDDEEIWRALETVGLLEYLAEDGITLDTQCSNSDFERDVRRLLFLVTMLLEEHTILVIEEPRGAVGDSKFEKQFDQALDDLFSDCTRIIIAHRSETLLGCEKLLFLDSGRIGSYGTKHDLMVKKCPFFAQISRQSRLLSSS
eukprot:sb/3463361/